MVVVVVAREGRWEGPLCGEEEVFHYGCRLHYIRQAVHRQIYTVGSSDGSYWVLLVLRIRIRQICTIFLNPDPS